MGRWFFWKGFCRREVSETHIERQGPFAVFPQCSNLKADMKYNLIEYYTDSTN